MIQNNAPKIFIFLFLLLVNDYTGYSQFENYKQVVELSKKQKVTEKVVDSILKTYTNRDKSYANMTHSFSFYFYRITQEYDLAIKYGAIEIRVLDSLKVINKEYANALYNMGKFYSKKKMFYEAIKFYKKAIKTNKHPLKTAQSYCQLGDCYFKIGDYYKSTDFYNKGLSLIEKHGSRISLITKYIMYSFNCNQLDTKKSIESGIFYLKKADSIIQNTPNLNVSSTLKRILYGSLGNLYSSSKAFNYGTANDFYHGSLKLAKKSKDTSGISNIYLNLGELHFKIKNDSSIYYLKKSIKYDINKYNLNETYRNIANYYTWKQNYEKALSKIKKSINYNFKVQKNNDIELLPVSKILNVEYKRSSIRALKTKSEIILNLYQSTKNTSYLNQIIENVEISNKFVSIVNQYNSEINSKFLWREEVSENFSLGIYAAYLLDDASTIFELMEANKAFLLSQDIEVKKQFLNLPSELVYEDNTYKKNILKLEERKDSLNKFSLRDSLFTLKEKYQNFRDSINLIYPEYLSLDRNIKPVTLEMVKNDLDKNDVVISFSVNNIKIGDEKSSLIGLVITKDKTIPFKTPESEKTIESLNTYRKLLSSPLKTKEELNEFKSVSYFLYNQLFPTPEIKELIKNKDVLIVPDVSMENTPLEALISEKDSLHFLVEDCNISYAYSLTFSELNKDVIRKTSNDISLYSPIKFDNTTISSLPFTEKESNDIENIISGNFHQFDNANKSNFLKNSVNSKIIHLATHANASGNPQIQFYDSILPLHELYTYKNNADLVVLSACETNLGEIKKGEGVLSLARGFFHSGANSVVSSLWKINDASTSEIMTDFYKNLKDNQSKTLALNNAKRSYLKNHSLSEKSPYYWASFVLIGDTNPVFESNIVLYISIILTFIVLVFLFLRRKVVKHKKHEAK